MEPTVSSEMLAIRTQMPEITQKETNYIIKVSSHDHGRATGLKFKLKVGQVRPRLRSLVPPNTLIFKQLGW